MDPRFQSVSGGRGANTNAANQYVINDGFEALHVRRLKHVWQHLTERLDAVEDSARELSVAVALAVVDDEIPARFRASRTRPHHYSRVVLHRGPRPRGTGPRRSSPRRSCRGVIRRRRGLHRATALRGAPAARTRRPRAGRSARRRAPPPDDDPPPTVGRPASPPRDGGSAPVSRRSSDAYGGEPASTEAADPRDEGTVRGDPDVEKLAPP